MARRKRLHIAGLPLHIIQRGNNRGACFFAEPDYRMYLVCLAAFAARFQCAVHAYVLMTNHVHLLLTPGTQDAASRMMKHLSQHYVQYINRTYRRSGTLWDGRFKSHIVERAGYALACQRYIELNPVRAQLVSHARDYPWSSYRTNAAALASEFIVPHADYLALGDTPSRRAAQYRRCFPEDPMPHELRALGLAAKGGFAWGSPGFMRELGRHTGERVERLRRPASCPLPLIQNDT